MCSPGGPGCAVRNTKHPVRCDVQHNHHHTRPIMLRELLLLVDDAEWLDFDGQHMRRWYRGVRVPGTEWRWCRVCTRRDAMQLAHHGGPGGPRPVRAVLHHDNHNNHDNHNVCPLRVPL